MKNKSTKKRTILKTALVLVVIAGALFFLLPSRCGNESSESVSPQPGDLNFESGSNAWSEPEKTDSRAERHDEAPPVRAPFTVIAPMDTGSSDIEKTQEKSVIAATGTSEQIDEAMILAAKNESVQDEDSSVMPDAVPVQAEGTAAAIPVIGETKQRESVNIQAEETRAVTETADKNKALPPEVIVKKSDAVPPKAIVNTSGTEMPEAPSEKIETESPKVGYAKSVPEVNPESLKITVGTSKEKAALDVKNMSGAGNTSTVQRASPSSAGNEVLVAKSILSPPKDTTSKSIQPVVVPSYESQKVTEQQITEGEKSGALVPETKLGQELAKGGMIIPESVSDKAEPPQKSFESRGKTEQRTAEKAGGFSAELLVEGNRATRQGWGIGAGMSAGYEVSEAFTIGVKGVYGNDMRGIESFEGLLYGRYYLPYSKKEFGIFAQLGIGGITFTEARQKAAASVLVDISLGVRFSLGNFYLEPYIRGGYMIQIGAGLAFGYRLEG
jgi:hypothetical protein